MADFEKDIIACCKILQEGGIILYPTDTVWGIGCDATNEKAVEKIFTLKKRPSEKAMIVLVAEEKDVLTYIAAPDLTVFDYLKHSRKPTTVVYSGAIGLAENLTAEDGSVAIRICKDEFCKHLLKRYRKPLVSTSANLSGEKSSGTFSDISEYIKNGVDYMVNHRREDSMLTHPSSVIKWEKGRAIILRP